MNDLATRLRSKSLEHPSATHHHGKRIESMHAVQPHGEITGYIKPEWHILLLPRFGIGLGKLIEEGPGFDETEEIGLKHLTGPLHIIELPVPKRLHNERLIVLEDH
jgi:hypothetical protein